MSSSRFSAQVAPGAPSIKVVTFSAKAPVGLDLETHDTSKTIVVKGAKEGSIAANVSVESSRARRGRGGGRRRNAPHSQDIHV